MSNKIKISAAVAAAMILAAALSRLLPHPYNFTPIGAIGLFGAAHFSRKYLSYFIPFAALWLSDLLLNNLVYAPMYPEFYGEGFIWFGASSLWVYLGFGLIILMGTAMLRRVRISNLLAASLLASLLFFLVTNFGAWIASPLAPKTVAGLLATYIAGVPFFWNTLAGDLFYVALLFGAFEWAQRRIPALQTDKAKA